MTVPTEERTLSVVPDGDDDLLPGEDGITTDPDPEVEGSSIVDAPKKSRARQRRRPPANLAEPTLEIPVILRLISLGKSVANVTATLGIELGYPVDLTDLMGEKAHAMVFRGDYLGEGIRITGTTETVDPENSVTKKFKVLIPRWNSGTDQLSRYVQPLLPDEVDLLGLMGLSTAWRLNVTVEIGGTLTIHEQQGSLGLTEKATTDEPGDSTYEPIRPEG